ncbi:MAG TPA: GntR family transcriptional regulator [Falsiroseomonas sp.]|nr:GntR family transcriptional regulator [Falsiroseomonas sp.]
MPSGGFVPLHERVTRDLSERILMGDWPPGAVLPGEVELAARFGVAIGTVRRALAILVTQGLLARRPRVGTVVTGHSPEHSLRFFFQYFRLHGADGTLAHSRAVPLSIAEAPAGEDEVLRLGLAPGSPLLDLRRLRLVDGQPVMLDCFRIPAARVPGFPRDAAALPELLYRYLLEVHGIRVSAVREELRAELGTAQELKLLELPTPSALLVIEAVVFDQTGAPCLSATQRARTERHRYLNEVS